MAWTILRSAPKCMNIERDDSQSLTGAGTANYRGNEVGGHVVFSPAHVDSGSRRDERDPSKPRLHCLSYRNMSASSDACA